MQRRNTRSRPQVGTPVVATMASLTRISHSSSADVAQALVPAVSRLVSTRVAGVTRCRTKSVPMSGDAAGMSACATDYPTDACEKCGLKLRDFSSEPRQGYPAVVGSGLTGKRANQ